MQTSRRQFIRAASNLGLTAAAQQFSAPLAMSLAGMAALGSHSANAADASNGYRAVVCFFMAGGNDSHNWVVPTDASGYAEYAGVRRELAWPAQRLLPMTCVSQGTGRTFGMPIELEPLHKWYEAGRAAIIANVGPLVRPISKAEFQASVDLPSKLFSHNDQQSTWQSLSPEGARSGWGGRMGDILMSANQYPVLTAVSSNGNAVFLSGNSATQYQVGPAGPVHIRALGSSWVGGSSTTGTVLKRTLAAAGDNPWQSEYTRVMQRSIETDAILQSAIQASVVPAIPATTVSTIGGGTTTLDKTGIARQLRVIAQMMAAGQTLGMKRQVFMVPMSGFDTHAFQIRDQPALMAQVANSLDYFLQAMSTMGLLNNVLLFSASDFGRTLVNNGSGSDHGWGSHHFVAGGAVRGTNIYGRFPVTALNTNDDIGSGRLLPSTSVTTLAATLCSWMGVSRTEMPYVLPNVGNFPDTLGFI